MFRIRTAFQVPASFPLLNEDNGQDFNEPFTIDVP